MNEQIKQIAERLRGLRDVLDLTPEEVAESCQMPLEAYLEMESGNKDISVSALQQHPSGPGLPVRSEVRRSGLQSGGTDPDERIVSVTIIKSRFYHPHTFRNKSPFFSFIVLHCLMLRKNRDAKKHHNK